MEHLLDELPRRHPPRVHRAALHEKLHPALRHRRHHPAQLGDGKLRYPRLPRHRRTFHHPLLLRLARPPVLIPRENPVAELLVQRLQHPLAGIVQAIDPRRLALRPVCDVDAAIRHRIRPVVQMLTRAPALIDPTLHFLPCPWENLADQSPRFFRYPFSSHKISFLHTHLFQKLPPEGPHDSQHVKRGHPIRWIG